MAVINTGLLERGLRSEFFIRFEGTPTVFGDLSTRIVSTGASETYRWLGTVPRMREWGGGRVAQGLRTESYSVENLKYEATIEVDRDEIADDQTGQIRIRISELAQRAATHKDYLISQLLENGNQPGYEGYDGVPFFSDAHPLPDGTTQSNQVVVDAILPSNPTADEYRAALRKSIGSMLAIKDDRGEPMMTSASGLVMVVPPAHYFAALEAINASVVNGTANSLEGAARVVVFPWLSDDKVWYLTKTDGVVRPFIFQDREPVEFTALAEDSEEGFKREKFLYGVRARYRMAYGYWQFAVRVEFV